MSTFISQIVLISIEFHTDHYLTQIRVVLGVAYFFKYNNSPQCFHYSEISKLNDIGLQLES